MQQTKAIAALAIAASLTACSGSSDLSDLSKLLEPSGSSGSAAANPLQIQGAPPYCASHVTDSMYSQAQSAKARRLIRVGTPMAQLTALLGTPYCSGYNTDPDRGVLVLIWQPDFSAEYLAVGFNSRDRVVHWARVMPEP